MEHTGKRSPYGQLNYTPPWHPFPYVTSLMRLTLFVSICFMVLILGTKFVGRLIPRNAISATTFEIALANALESDAFCPERSHLRQFQCVVYVSEGVITSIHVEFIDGELHRTHYRFQEDTVRIGDLIVVWGNPETVRLGDIVFLYWNNRHVFAAAQSQNGRLLPFLSTSQIAIGSTDFTAPPYIPGSSCNDRDFDRVEALCEPESEISVVEVNT